MKEHTCSGEHSVHICELAGKGRFVEIKDVTRYPNFMCMNCGRVAAFDKNLCNPVSIDSIRPGGA